jgi:hypothetical protein
MVYQVASFVIMLPGRTASSGKACFTATGIFSHVLTGPEGAATVRALVSLFDEDLHVKNKKRRQECRMETLDMLYICHINTEPKCGTSEVAAGAGTHHTHT